MKKIFICLGLVFLGTSSGAIFAKEFKDCSSLNSKVEEKLIQDYGLLNKDDVTQAINNLKGYCCQKNFISKDTPECKKNYGNNYPESPYLMDQLFDIAFRKLDGDIEKIYPHLKSDTKGKERLENVRKITEDGTKNTPSKKLIDDFKKQRDPSLLTIIQPTKTCGYFPTDDTNLSTKYYQVCNVAYCIGQNILQPNVLSTYDFDIGYQLCTQKAQEIIMNNALYIQSMAIQQGLNYMIDNSREYLISYFSKNRLDQLIEKTTNVLTLFQRITLKTTGVRECK